MGCRCTVSPSALINTARAELADREFTWSLWHPGQSAHAIDLAPAPQSCSRTATRLQVELGTSIHPSSLGAAMILVLGVWTFLRTLLGSSAAVTLDNVALRHQLAAPQRSVARPRLRRRDRIFWISLSRLWAGWRASLVIVQPATVLAWHRPKASSSTGAGSPDDVQ